jgi:hypothetical protein
VHKFVPLLLQMAPIRANSKLHSMERAQDELNTSPVSNRDTCKEPLRTFSSSALQRKQSGTPCDRAHRPVCLTLFTSSTPR